MEPWTVYLMMRFVVIGPAGGGRSLMIKVDGRYLGREEENG